MTIEDRDNAHLVTHALAKDTLSRIRDVETEQVSFRKGLVKLGRICGYEIIDGRMETEYVEIETPLEQTMGERVRGLDDVVIINVLRAATPFVEGLLKAFPRARQESSARVGTRKPAAPRTAPSPLRSTTSNCPRSTRRTRSSSPTRCSRRGVRCVPSSNTSSTTRSDRRT